MPMISLRTKTVIFSMLIFISGVIIGGSGAVLYVRHRILTVLEGGPDAMHELLVRRLSRKLQLNESQRAIVFAATKSVESELLAIRREQFPRIKVAIERGVEEISPSLTAPQREELRAMTNKFLARMERRSGAGS